ncbi:PREDICTED: putative B3 domain-containing protein At4g03170 [Camelina sativa]|uniref:B3 domain-containing protein At4g03170 n=1 Tax=Camelina sativa TaxID=90675 RepID=A0ABM0YTQ1_CAMSA|nr:PREDICTED: putative B3 domain-containing protein At4g03170 [Camelina sativa]
MAFTQEEDEDLHVAAWTLMHLHQAQAQYLNQSPEEDDIDDEVESTPLSQVSQAHQKPSRKRKYADNNQNTMKINKEELFSEETLRLIQAWYRDDPDPLEIFQDAEVTRRFSKPLKKQLMSSDVDKDQCRLLLPRQLVEETMLPFLEESENLSLGLDVSVYGPDGEVQQMKFKIWNGVRTPVLTSGWKEFVAMYGLEMTSDFITDWMFRHIKTQKICFAIDYVRFSLIDPVG